MKEKSYELRQSVKEIRYDDFFKLYEKNVKHRIKIENTCREVGRDKKDSVKDMKTAYLASHEKAHLSRDAKYKARSIMLKAVIANHNRDFVPTYTSEHFKQIADER